MSGVLVTFCLAGLTAWYFWPVLAPSAVRSLGGDFAAQAYPSRVYATREMFEGRLPHWSPCVGFGFPLLADIEATVFYPVSLLVSLLVGPEVSYRVLEVQSVLHYVVGGLGMFLLLSRIGTQWLAALFGAVAFMFSGFLWAHGAHLNVVQSASWGPWALLGATFLLARPTWRAAVGTGVALALALLGGHPQISYYIVVALVFVLAVGGWRRPAADRDPGRVGRLASRTAVALLISVGLAALQLIPTVVLMVHSIRWKPLPGFVLSESLPLKNLITLVIPLAFHRTAGWVSVDEFHGYVEILPLILAAWAIFASRSRWTTIFGLLAVFGILVAVGTPGLRGLGGIGLFRAHARAVYLFDLGIAGLSALGVDALLRGSAAPDRERRLLRVLWASCLLVGSGEFWIAARGVPSLLRDRLSPEFTQHSLMFVGLLVLSVVAVTVACRLRAHPVLTAAVMVGVLLLDVFSFPRALAWPGVPPDGHWPPRGDLAALSRELGPYRVLNDRLFRRSETMEANIGLIYRVPLTSVYSSLTLSRYKGFVASVNPTLSAVPRVTDLIGVRYILSGRGLTGLADATSVSGFTGPSDTSSPRVIARRGENLWEIPGALPRAYLSGEIRVVRGRDRVLRALESVDPRQTVILEERNVSCPHRLSRAPESTDEVRFLADEPDRVRLMVRAREAGPLVLSDTYYPGWRAAIDGVSTKIHRANALFRAVCLPAGEHVVEFRYHPLDFQLGLAITGLTLVGSVLLLRRRRLPEIQPEGG